MGSNLMSRTPRQHSIRDLLTSLKTGKLQYPKPDREFTWPWQRRLQLVDSLIQGYPIGALLVVRTTLDLRGSGVIGPVTIPNEVPEGHMREYVLDGQQRLSTLMGAMGSALWTEREEELPPWDEDATDGTPWTMSYDIGEAPDMFYDHYEAAPPVLGETGDLLKITSVLDQFEFDTYIRRKCGDVKVMRQRAQMMRFALLDARIPVMVIHTDDLDVIRSARTRIRT